MQDAATLGLTDRLDALFTGAGTPNPEEVNRAFWGACHGGQHQCAEFLLDRGADRNWLPAWQDCTPLDATTRSGAADLVAWLRSRDAATAAELGRRVHHHRRAAQ